MVQMDVVGTEWEKIVAFPSRSLLTCSVIGVMAASSGAAFSMAPTSAASAVRVPDFGKQPAAAAPVRPAPPPAAVPAIVVPPVTGAQIAGLAIAPARDRVDAIVAEKAKSAAVAEAAR